MNQQSPLTFHVTNLFLLLVTTVLMQHSRLEAQDWMQFRGAGGAAASADADLPIKWDADANIKWKAELPGPGASSPIIVGDKVFLTCYLGKLGLFAFDLDGKQLWKKEIEYKTNETRWGSAASPILFGDNLILNAIEECGKVFSIAKSDGEIKWEFSTDAKLAYATPNLVTAANGDVELVLPVPKRVTRPMYLHPYSVTSISIGSMKKALLIVLRQIPASESIASESLASEVAEGLSSLHRWYPLEITCLLSAEVLEHS